MTKDAWIDKAISAQRESKSIEFKSAFDVSSNGDWCEVIKDIVAIANSGGGVVVFGVSNVGIPSGAPLCGFAQFDSAKITDKIARYTDRQFADFHQVMICKGGVDVEALVIDDAIMPMVFVKAGTYSTPEGKEKTSFQNGTIYVRHGAKSEPATPDDLTGIIDRQVERRRRMWLRNIRKIADASTEQEMVLIRRPEGSEIGGPAVLSRIVAQADAPGAFPANADEQWPYRGKALQQKVNEILDGRARINSFDIQAVRTVYQMETKYPQFAYRPFSLAAAQYSPQFVAWLVDQFNRDPQFFEKTRKAYTQNALK